jgi:hypothetical protein
MKTLITMLTLSASASFAQTSPQPNVETKAAREKFANQLRAHTGFKIADALFPAGLALFLGVAVTYLKLSWYWLIVSLALGAVIFSVPIGKSLFNRTKRDVQ